MRSVLVAAGAAVLLVVLSGCDGPPPHVTPVPTPSVTPVFASDEEALAAAEESYRAYLAVSDQILHEGGENPERIDEFATEEVAADEKTGFQFFADKSYTSVGQTSFRDMQLESYDDAEVRVYVCTDSSAVDVIDSSGASVVPADRNPLVPFEIGFEVDSVTPIRLVMSSKVVWEGDGVCTRG